MKALYLIAEINPNPDNLERLSQEFRVLIEKTRAEEGCLLYELVEEEGFDGWLMLEKWESRDHWERHIESEHVKRINSLDELFTNPTNLRFMTEVAT